MSETALRLRGITKRFGSLVANDGISLDLGRGEVLALLGENGAGKSTLVSILFGHYLADAGSIEVFGAPLPPGQPKAALAAGIGMVHQHFTLADNLSVLDNVMLGTEPLWWPFSRRAEARARLLDAAQRFGLQVDPDAQVGTLSVGERQRVEILKALTRGAKILILDEPTAVLTPQESESLFATLGQLVAAGLSVIFISHKLDEVLRVSHRIAVLRGGKLVADLPAAGADKAMLAEAMVGREVAPAIKRAQAPGAPVVELHGGTVCGPGARPLLDGIQLELRAGEVFAVAGVAGNGQDVLAELLCGLHALDAGTLTVAGRTLPARPRAFVEAGVARIPEDRHAVGVVGDLPLWENAVLERYASPAFSRHGIVRRERAMAFAQSLVERFDVRGTESAGLATTTRSLSGGNMQKLILGRALAGDPEKTTAPPLIVANQPTWGLDIGAVAYVHQQLLDACAQGSAVLLISEDLDEVFALADRIAVMHHGRLGAARPAREWTLAAIGLAMAGGGANPEAAHAA
ncbi:ABC transporter ATP-binding protein [Rhizobacter sp. AJA081-3]|uniref:ABC transporter ATP-binding protein n=1 Tax=Rhizobacter sp. AJA081-3 TaxID=2753607 RepID=UPI001AE00547|nr:ABC transporter ATP-binding protein [Rhizobacter sp. AJA081-3]QTN22806.1 ABC transporter ATP-binding protein [Rhizobacter sp. AJA081-3]